MKMSVKMVTMIAMKMLPAQTSTGGTLVPAIQGTKEMDHNVVVRRHRIIIDPTDDVKSI